VLDRWALTAGPAFSGGNAGTVLAVTRADGSPAVLKIGFPHAEGIPEAIALEAYPRGTAPLVPLQDPWTWPMLLERIDPGTPLANAGLDTGAALLVGAGLLARIGRAAPVDGIPEVRTVVGGYSAAALTRWPEHRGHLDTLRATDLVSSALDDLVALAGDDVAVAMLHGDFNPDNILCSPSGMFAIDPKPMVGDPAFDLWPLVSQLGAPFSRADPPTVLAGQLELVAGEAGCDATRCRLGIRAHRPHARVVPRREQPRPRRPQRAGARRLVTGSRPAPCGSGALMASPSRDARPG